MASQKKLKAHMLSALFASKQQKMRHLSHYLTAGQKRELLVTLGDSCFIVLDHYIYKAYIKSTDFSDKRVSLELGMSERKVQRARQSLIKHGWFYQKTYHAKNAPPILATAIGKSDVQILKQEPDKALHKIMQEILEICEIG